MFILHGLLRGSIPVTMLHAGTARPRYAQKIINFKLTGDNIASASSFRPADAVIFTNPNSPGDSLLNPIQYR
jgi:hypothetical protein